ncbi:hypothetical protein BJ508DRAFT_132004 [Ascobolus immersus RN42]|uniref:Uncharacterized protein n=1 Tax=Ascobolus immersus RN42 TaxID=1160509 RepID=A0A3N4I1T4_ASCIM|nr:hypothetical protein BJ508DRAFT_132004 [Ascobolus immersus RN42]
MLSRSRDYVQQCYRNPVGAFKAAQEAGQPRLRAFTNGAQAVHNAFSQVSSGGAPVKGHDFECPNATVIRNGKPKRFECGACGAWKSSETGGDGIKRYLCRDRSETGAECGRERCSDCWRKHGRVLCKKKPSKILMGEASQSEYDRPAYQLEAQPTLPPHGSALSPNWGSSSPGVDAQISKPPLPPSTSFCSHDYNPQPVQQGPRYSPRIS